MLSNNTTRALIVCPAQLQDNWSADKFAEWGIIATTVSMESLPILADIEEEPSPVQRQRLRAELKRYQDQYDVILVDESHNFRNPRTKRYRALMEIIRGGKPDTRVVLMTATPINNSVWDLYHQLMLITRGDDTWYAGRGPIPNLREAFQAIEKGESRVPGSGVRGRGSGERETTASSLAGKEESSRKEDNSGQGKDGPAGVVAQGGNGR